MGKDPAFLFYTKDFFILTATLNWEDRGKLMTILCIMHQQGRQDEESIRFLVGSISEKLRSQFTVDQHGLWFCEWLEQRIDERNKFVASRHENGLKGGRPRKSKPKEKLKETVSFQEPEAKQNLAGDAVVNEKAIENSEVNPKKERLKKVITDLVFPFDSAEFMQAWQAYIQMRVEKKKPLKTKTGQQAKLKTLSKIDERTAILMLYQSAENEWLDLYPLKNDFITKQQASGFIGESIGISREETVERLSSYTD